MCVLKCKISLLICRLPPVTYNSDLVRSDIVRNSDLVHNVNLNNYL